MGIIISAWHAELNQTQQTKRYISSKHGLSVRYVKQPSDAHTALYRYFKATMIRHFLVYVHKINVSLVYFEAYHLLCLLFSDHAITSSTYNTCICLSNSADSSVCVWYTYDMKIWLLWDEFRNHRTKIHCRCTWDKDSKCIL